MSIEPDKVTVEIFGEKHVVRGNERPEYIQKLARKVDQKMHEISQRFPRMALHQVAILTALNFADELEKLREEQETLLQLLGEKEEEE